jgi:hypothetical protein
LRRELGLNGHVFDSLLSIGEALGVSGTDLNQAVVVYSHPQVFDALVSPNEFGSPGFSIGHSHDTAARFAFCRCLFEYLTARFDAPFLVTTARSQTQSRNRSFAAEFLAPADELRSRVQREVVAEEEVDELAEAFHVSSFVIRHQLENHRIAKLASAQ